VTLSGVHHARLQGKFFVPSAATEKTAARFAEAGSLKGTPHEREDIMVELLIVGLIVGVLGVKGWKRAMHRRLINQRLRDWCRR
jgi:hypothetical protein